MSTKNTGGPAFPESYPGSDPRTPGWVGGSTTLRDYFAAKAMQALIPGFKGLEITSDVTHVAMARVSYRIADAMLAERE